MPLFIFVENKKWDSRDGFRCHIWGEKAGQGNLLPVSRIDMKSAAVIQAAGKGSRFHSDHYKLLAPVDGVPMILRTLQPVLEAGFDDVLAVIGAHADEMRNVLVNYPVRIIENTEWEKGQSTSLAAGVRAAADTSDRVCLLLGDQPFLRTSTLRALLAESDAHPSEIIVPFYQGKRGNPIIVPASLYGLLLELSQGDMGGKKLLQTAGYHELSVEDQGILRDVDTIEELKNMSENFRHSDTNFWTVIDGKIEPVEHGTKTIAETEKFTPIGAYTSFRTYGSFGVLRLSRHFDRLEETARLAGYDIRPDREELKHILTKLIKSALESSPDVPERRIRVTIDLQQNIGRLYIAMEPLMTPAPEKYKEGIVCRTAEAHRDNPKAKLSNFLARADGIRKQETETFDEILMYTPSGDLLEGLSSNFFGIKGDTIYTAEEGVLSGTTRDFILKIAADMEIPVRFEPVKKDGIPELDEAFISSTSRAILPIRSIDGIELRQSVPGPVTKRLMEKFDEELASGIEKVFD